MADVGPHIELRGIRVRNLRGIDLNVPLRRLVAITGVSGAGKSSLAFETLFAEGRRRYVETLSTASRGLLDPVARPEVDFIGQIPPAIAVRQRFAESSWRPTVATASEIHPLLRLIFSRAARLTCPKCQIAIESHTPSEAARVLRARPAETRIQVAFPLNPAQWTGTQHTGSQADLVAQLLKGGFVRAIVGERTQALGELANSVFSESSRERVSVVVDRVTAGSEPKRLIDSLELAYRHGQGVCQTFTQARSTVGDELPATRGTTPGDGDERVEMRIVDGQPWICEHWSELLQCPGCGSQFSDPDPLLFSFNQSRSACERCHGLGLLPSKRQQDRETSVRSTRTQAAPTPQTVDAAEDSRQCPDCQGLRLRAEALAWQFDGQSIAGLLRQSVGNLLSRWPALRERLAGGSDGPAQQAAETLERRLRLLDELGLGYLELDRPLKTLAAGESQRVRLAGALATELVHMLYVLDEPAAGLHPRDRSRLADALLRLRDAGNSVVVVEHSAEIISSCDYVIDLGPGAGSAGGTVVFAGTPAELIGAVGSETGAWLAKRNAPGSRRVVREPSGWLELTGVTRRNLKSLSVRFPLGVLCVVTGVSGSGKTTLTAETLVPLVRAAQRAETTPPARNAVDREAVTGAEQLHDVQLIEQGPLGRSLRSTPATFLGLLAPIRQLFAATAEAQSRNFGPGHFSFHASSAGRCETCDGTGVIAIDLQFLPDIVSDCPDCHGTRFRPEVLKVRYRGLSIAEVLSQSAQEALPFFRGQTRIQKKLKLLADVGLDMLSLGQPAQSLSAGETQRLRLAECLTRVRGGNCLIVLDEPTRGLHPADIARLLTGFDYILAAGHSLVVVEHQTQVIAQADWQIDLGPGAGDAGGRIVSAGPPAK